MLVPFSRPHEYVKEFKQSPRREDDIAIVNAGMRVRLEPATDGSWVVAEAAFAFGGVAAKALMAEQVAQAVLGKPWTQKTLEVGRGGEGRGVYTRRKAPLCPLHPRKPCVYKPSFADGNGASLGRSAATW